MPIVATTKNNLKEVWDLMIKHQITEMIVVDNEADLKFIGTVDMLDIIGEIISNGEEKHQ
jgi:CBS domain-containing protein